MIRRILLFVFVLLVFFALYTFYCLVSETNLCDLKKTNPAITAFMKQRQDEWKEKKLRKKIIQKWIPLSSISPYLKNSVVATEDPNFYHHHGLDFYAIRLAMRDDLSSGRIISGASTITQQLMKNLYLSPSRNPLRKWREAILSIRVERCVGKKRILEIYLNVIEWGDSIYGIEAASHRYFGKPASALDPAESAMLTAMIPNPIYYNPYRKNRELVRNRNNSLKLMWKMGFLSKAQYEAAVASPIRLR